MGTTSSILTHQWWFTERKKALLRIWRYVGAVPRAKHYHCRIDYDNKYFSDKFVEYDDAMFWFANTFLREIGVEVPYTCEYIDGFEKKRTHNWFDKALRDYWRVYIIGQV